MAGFSLSTSGAGRHINPLLFQKMEHGFRLNAATGEIEDIRKPILRALQHHVGNLGKLSPSIFPQGTDLLFFLQYWRKRSYGCSKSTPSRHGFGTGTHIFFLAASQRPRRDVDAFSNIQSARSLRPMDFVSTNRHQIYPNFSRLQRQFSKSLHRIYMQERASLVPPDCPGSRFNGQNTSYLIIHCHHTHKSRFRCNSFFHLLR